MSRYMVQSPQYVTAADLAHQSVILDDGESTIGRLEELLRQVDNVHVCVDCFRLGRHVVRDGATPVAVIAGMQSDFHAIQFGQHAHEISAVVGYGRTCNTVL